ncbi:hypothetical protein [Actinokineospora spheciospongiae]|uniref:hypothetical protein n=1 Tax=Actinokineospora spheciospongiae TaxID=909613 RepID=UPI0005500C52|nr:hypothetical protein [Actinokineospora spheciospongiae]
MVAFTVVVDLGLRGHAFGLGLVDRLDQGGGVHACGDGVLELVQATFCVCPVGLGVGDVRGDGDPGSDVVWGDQGFLFGPTVEYGCG